MLFAAIVVAIFSTAAVALTVGMYARRESILGLYALIAAMAAAFGGVVIATMDGAG